VDMAHVLLLVSSQLYHVFEEFDRERLSERGRGERREEEVMCQG